MNDSKPHQNDGGVYDREERAHKCWLVEEERDALRAQLAAVEKERDEANRLRWQEVHRANNAEAALLAMTKERDEAELVPATHDAPARCPTWYDSCGCTVETLTYNIDRAESEHQKYLNAEQQLADARAEIDLWRATHGDCDMEQLRRAIKEWVEADDDPSRTLAAGQRLHKAIVTLRSLIGRGE